MKNQNKQILIIGYGNPGRQDDGLGPALIEELETLEAGDIQLQSNYQLTVEDAYDIQAFKQVVFVDASLNATPPFSFTEIDNTNESALGSHSLSPHAVLQLCETLYQQQPKAFVLAIRGYEFDQFEEELSAKAKSNLDQALNFLTTWISQNA